MKSTKLYAAISIGALFAVLSSGAFADDKYNGELDFNSQDPIVSTKTRAQVIEELKQAQAQGQYQQPEYVEFKHVMPHSALSRAEVRAEAIQQSAENHQRQPDDVDYGG